MSFYDQAAKDSLKRSEWMRSDPYYKMGSGKEGLRELEGFSAPPAPGSAHSFNPAPVESGSPLPEQTIMEKLAVLQKGLNEPSSPREQKAMGRTPARPDRELSRDVDRLEDLMGQLKRNAGEDPELGQLEKMMDKILDIQHPERVRQRLQEGPAKEDAGDPLSSALPAATVSLLQSGMGEDGGHQGFYSGKEKETPAEETATMEAVVHGTQTLRDGAVAKLRLTRAVQVVGAAIPPGTILYGRVSLGKERMLIRIQSLSYQGALFPVNLEVYDLDGLAGVAVPGALAREAVKESADRSLATLEGGLLNPSLKTKAAAAGLSTAKNLLSRKVKEVKVTVKAGYKVLLRDKNDRS